MNGLKFEEGFGWYGTGGIWSYNGDYDFGYALGEAGVDGADVKRVVRSRDGENDGPQWLYVMEMNDGQWCFVEAGCDYTGWDCQAGGQAFYASSEAELVRTRLTQSDRRDLGYDEPKRLGNIDI